jgi:hypothetical protein
MEAGESRITVSVSYWRRRMHSAQGEMVYGERRMAGARKLRWGSTHPHAANGGWFAGVRGRVFRKYREYEL